MIIYKVTNLTNNKVYIGKTIKSLTHRKNNHLSDARRGGKSLFHRAIRKYGAENFCWEVMDKVMFSDLLLELEKFYISKYNSKAPNGYNLTDGGDGNCGWHPSGESRRKMSDAHLGKRQPLSEETKRKIGEANKLSLLGKHPSEETKRKMSESRTGKKHSHHRGHPLSEETKRKIGNANSGERSAMFGRHGKLHPFFGKHHTEDALKKMRRPRSGKCVTVDVVN